MNLRLASRPINHNYVAILIFLTGIGLAASRGNSGHLAVILASSAILSVVNIARVSDDAFIRKHRTLTALALAGINLPLIHVLATETVPRYLPDDLVTQSIVIITTTFILLACSIYGFWASTRPMAGSESDPIA